ncbi:uncharacterized protein CLUP02_01319 [Colletotrichum lupini]|uniref:Uncharacterized protein n=1 Tax=Colletotrichum lupini TaxID=145971 RepID=A0A9Q8SC36_9PEZI|nr:uncharacterized protein CLUP02_01319 [Colletotrichum lupini]UQC74667.1 hypothetical protein CLUP02_01319 [Colletotrichum lupini]
MESYILFILWSFIIDAEALDNMLITLYTWMSVHTSRQHARRKKIGQPEIVRPQNQRTHTTSSSLLSVLAANMSSKQEPGCEKPLPNTGPRTKRTNEISKEDGKSRSPGAYGTGTATMTPATFRSEGKHLPISHEWMMPLPTIWRSCFGWYLLVEHVVGHHDAARGKIIFVKEKALPRPSLS